MNIKDLPFFRKIFSKIYNLCHFKPEFREFTFLVYIGVGKYRYSWNQEMVYRSIDLNTKAY